jgi:hypothetical protein
VARCEPEDGSYRNEGQPVKVSVTHHEKDSDHRFQTTGPPDDAAEEELGALRSNLAEP